MNSIFSPFDFLCAELFGQKVKAHLPPALSTVAGGDSSPLQRRERAPNTPRTESKSDNVTEQRKMEKQKESSPRFALELDGIHCFETIVKEIQETADHQRKQEQSATMKSIFSPFDCLCAELFGQKVKAHLPPALSTVAGGDSSPLQRRERAPNTPRTESKSDNVTEQRKMEKQKESTPRFALELDGIHCFETIVSH